MTQLGSSDGPRLDQASSARRLWHIQAKAVFDPFTQQLLPNRIISVDEDTGLIVDLHEDVPPQNGSPVDRDRRQVRGGDDIEVVDLKHLTVLPGFVDVHVHFFLHSYSETPWTTQVIQESTAERTIRATVHARQTLLAGFTTVRDLGTEGAEDADIALRKCLANALIPGPRYYCANRAIVSTGGYGPKSEIHVNREGVDGMYGAEVADGKDACIKAVRRQIGAGADWIKIYADYRARARMAHVSSAIGTQVVELFNRDELRHMINTAHNSGVKVAVHSMSGDAMVRTLLELGADSIEHVGDFARSSLESQNTLLSEMARSKTIWVPTLAVYHAAMKRGGPDAQSTWDRVSRTFAQAVHEVGMENIACGGDTGAFPHGENGLEMVLMRRLGVEWSKVLKWGTLGGWECIRGMEWEGDEGRARLERVEAGEVLGGLERDMPFGAVKAGWVADLIGIEGKVDGTPEEFEKAIMDGVQFVMKSGKCCKLNGLACLDGY